MDVVVFVRRYECMAGQKIRHRTAERWESSRAQGVTLVTDLCSVHHYIYLYIINNIDANIL